VRRVDADVLVQGEAAHLRQVHALEARAQGLVDRERRRSGGQAEHGVGAARDELRDLVGDELSGGGLVRDDDDLSHAARLFRVGMTRAERPARTPRSQGGGARVSRSRPSG